MSSTDESKHSRAERITMGISIVILVGIVGLAVWSSIMTGSSDPEIEVTVNLEGVRETDTGFYLPVTITNTGGLTAEGATVTGELKTDDEEEPQTAEVSIDFLAGGEVEQAALVFDTDPREGDLSVGPTSYLHP